MFPFSILDINLHEFFEVLKLIKPIIDKFKNLNDSNHNIWKNDINNKYFSEYLSKFFISTSKFFDNGEFYDFEDINFTEDIVDSILFNTSKILFDIEKNNLNDPLFKEKLIRNLLYLKIKSKKYEIPKNILDKINSESIRFFERSFWNSEILPILTQRGVMYKDWKTIDMIEVFSILE